MNKKIAIRGSNIRTDIIKYLESLGGENDRNYNGLSNALYYYILESGVIGSEQKQFVPKDYTLLESVPQTNKIYELW